MNTTEICLRAATEVLEALAQLSPQEGDALQAEILRAKRIFVAGAGRAGSIMRGFGMRLMHMGFTTYVVGEAVTPGIAPGDLLIIGSGSGETGSLVHMAGKAKKLGATVALISIYPASSIGTVADICVKIPAPTPKNQVDSGVRSFQPMANLFEQSMLFFVDSVTMALMEQLGKTSDEMFLNHANLE